MALELWCTLLDARDTVLYSKRAARSIWDVQALYAFSVHRLRAELMDYDGFIVTHSPVFVRFFEHFKKPVILVNSCRYDQPFCWNADEKVAARMRNPRR